MSPPPETISKPEFDALLSAYPALIDAMSQAKSSMYLPTQKPGQKTLKDLDAYRYYEAPLLFSKQNREMTLADVQHLVEWKLRHGKFRPTLMSLVSSNPPSLTKQTISAAIKQYRTNPSTSTHAQAALDALSKLRGVGPATASLLLNVHDPENVVFFSDEAYDWLCRGGSAAPTPIRYTPAEYAQLRQRATELARRLGVGMVDVEKVAYVIIARGKSKLTGGSNKKKADKTANAVKPTTNKGEAPKRKTDNLDETGLRRSKRHRA